MALDWQIWGGQLGGSSQTDSGDEVYAETVLRARMSGGSTQNGTVVFVGYGGSKDGIRCT
jgi:hypothetical protein